MGMQVFGPPGSDGVNLSLLKLIGPLFGETQPPPFPSLCAGCTANVTTVEVPGPAFLHLGWLEDGKKKEKKKKG